MSQRVRYEVDLTGHGWFEMIGHDVGGIDEQKMIELAYSLLSEDYHRRCNGDARSRWDVRCVSHSATVAQFEITPIR